jgi:type I restriction enzyme S subunit
MELKPGFKQTEAGVIPNEWEAPLARDIGAFRGGNGFPLEAQGERHGAYPFYKVSDMNNEGNETFMTAANHWISEHTRKRLGATAFPADSIVFAKVGAAIFLERKKILGQPSCIDNNMAAFVLDKSRADVRFVHTLLLSKKLGALVATTALPALNGAQLGEMVLPLPPLPEQRAIATALSDVDGLLGGLDRLIAKKRDLKQAAMQQLLTGQTRLPGFHGEWEVKRLGEVATFFKGKGLPKSALSESGAEPCIHYGELFTRYPETIAEIFSRTDTSAGVFRSVANDVLMPTSDVTPRGLAKASCVRVDDVILGGDILVIRSDTNLIHGSFLSLVIRYEEAQVLQLVTGSTVYHLYGSDMKNFTFSVPSVPEQTAIAEVLTDMDAELAALEQRREKTRALKQAIMQELLTGRTRLV